MTVAPVAVAWMLTGCTSTPESASAAMVGSSSTCPEGEAGEFGRYDCEAAMVATTDTEVASALALWGFESGLVVADGSPFVFVGGIESGSCPLEVQSARVTDAGIFELTTDLGGGGDCTADANPRGFVFETNTDIAISAVEVDGHPRLLVPPGSSRLAQAALSAGAHLDRPGSEIGIEELAAASDLIFCGHLVATTPLWSIIGTEDGPPGSVDVLDGLVFQPDDVYRATDNPDVIGTELTIGHPVLLGADADGLVEAEVVGLPPVDVFADVLDDEALREATKFIVFARWDDRVEGWRLVSAAPLNDDLLVEPSGHTPFTTGAAQETTLVGSHVSEIAELIDSGTTFERQPD